MNELFVPYQLSLELKELGFNKPCIAFFNTKFDESLCFVDLFGFIREKTLEDFHINNDESKTAAPTFSQAFKFFRDKYNWQHSIEPTSDQHRFEVGYNYWIWNSKTGEEYHTMPKNRPTGDWEYETYPEAELACLIKLIELVKTKKL